MRRRFRSFDFGGFAAAPVRDDLSHFEQLVVVLLWGMADDHGRQPGDWRSLYSSAFPRLGPSMDEFRAAVEKLESLDEVLRYERDGRWYCQMAGYFDRESWQHASYRNGNRVSSDFPPPPKGAVTHRRRRPGRPANKGIPRGEELPNSSGDRAEKTATELRDSPSRCPSRGLGRRPKAETGDQDHGARGSSSALASEADASASPRLRGSELLEALFRVHADGCPNDLRPRLDAAINLGKSREPEFEDVGNRLLADPMLKLKQRMNKVGRSA